PLIATAIACSVALLLLATLTTALPSQHAPDPLSDVWLPQLFALDLTNTTASLAWRLTGGLPLLVLVLALGCALLALFATTRPQAAARRLALGLTVLLAAGVLFFSYPLDLVSKADTSKLSAVPGPVVSRE
ncbi:MAG: hypothetical protein ACTHMA_22515, partial [Thermomicrobiales bacterium]